MNTQGIRRVVLSVLEETRSNPIQEFNDAVAPFGVTTNLSETLRPFRVAAARRAAAPLLGGSGQMRRAPTLSPQSVSITSRNINAARRTDILIGTGQRAAARVSVHDTRHGRLSDSPTCVSGFRQA
jgi:hypothetical protein